MTSLPVAKRLLSSPVSVMASSATKEAEVTMPSPLQDPAYPRAANSGSGPFPERANTVRVASTIS